MLNDDIQIDLNRCYRASKNVIGRRILDSEYILVPLARSTADLECIFRLNPVGALIWERLDGHTPGSEIVSRITAEFDVSEAQAARDFKIFLKQLASITVLDIDDKGPQ